MLNSIAFCDCCPVEAIAPIGRDGHLSLLTEVDDENLLEREGKGVRDLGLVGHRLGRWARVHSSLDKADSIRRACELRKHVGGEGVVKGVMLWEDGMVKRFDVMQEAAQCDDDVVLMCFRKRGDLDDHVI